MPFDHQSKKALTRIPAKFCASARFWTHINMLKYDVSSIYQDQ
jgi:hypothetical protein